MPADRDFWNASRFRPDDDDGFYESYFQRANHPSRPLAFWIRYTVFNPRGHPDQARGELWAIYFDGESERIVAGKQTMPISECRFSPTGLNVQIGRSALNEYALDGSMVTTEHTVAWSLAYQVAEVPLLLLPESYYARALPRAKALVGAPNAIFNGSLIVDGIRIGIDGWRGSQNHNWGQRHTDRYAWAQVAGFDNAPGVFLECSTAQLKLGPVWSPRMTVLVLRDGDEEIALNGFWQSLRATARVDRFDWRIATGSDSVRVYGRIRAPADAFVGLRYDNPPGGSKTCLNCKLAGAEFTVERAGRPDRILSTRNRAAFEILTERDDHGVPVVA